MNNILNQLNFIKLSRDTFLSYKEDNDNTIKPLEHIEEKLKLIRINIENNSKNTIQNSFEKINKKNNLAKSWRNNITVIKKKDITELEQKCNEINSLLNKLSPINFEKIKNQILKYLEDDSNKGEMLKEFILSTINNIFSKAVLQPTYCPIYVKLLNILDKKFIIKDIINNKCLEFKDILNSKNKEAKAEADTEAEITCSKQKDDKLYDLFCNEVKNKNFKEGYSQFIGELYNNGMINYKTLELTINLFFNMLLDNLKEDATSNNVEYLIICLCKLFNTIKKNINNSKQKTLITKFKEILNYNIIKRLRFKIQDLLENRV